MILTYRDGNRDGICLLRLYPCRLLSFMYLWIDGSQSVKGFNQEKTLTASVIGQVKAAAVILPYFPPQTRAAPAELAARGCAARPPHIRLASLSALPCTARPVVRSDRSNTEEREGEDRDASPTRSNRISTVQDHCYKPPSI